MYVYVYIAQRRTAGWATLSPVGRVPPQIRTHMSRCENTHMNKHRSCRTCTTFHDRELRATLSRHLAAPSALKDAQENLMYKYIYNIERNKTKTLASPHAAIGTLRPAGLAVLLVVRRGVLQRGDLHNASSLVELQHTATICAPALPLPLPARRTTKSPQRLPHSSNATVAGRRP
jgi:hypothetical protein